MLFFISGHTFPDLCLPLCLYRYLSDYKLNTLIKRTVAFNNTVQTYTSALKHTKSTQSACSLVQTVVVSAAPWNSAAFM